MLSRILGRALIAATATAAALGALSLSACVSAQNCAIWVGFESSREMYDAAELVVVGDVPTESHERRIGGVAAQVYELGTFEVLKGDAGAAPLRVAAMPDPCGRPEMENLLADAGQSLLFLVESDDPEVWVTITPVQGVRPAEERSLLVDDEQAP
ncbi:hypothetical protein J4H92_09545 [Leucobacter weissii]|uniref:Lipoprotein n=1 Tax=Leucobacter weissii TaxID=1983706 RepID=A0A939MJN1_9MICO|nr:hypothetical protein [Leucobacter weissii]MBO1902189.1 hypothetical protein [Leucobacter weissii]